MNLETLLDEFFAAHSWSRDTVRGYRRVLLSFLRDIPDPQSLSAADFKAWLEGHETWGENMRWLAYIAVRHYLRWCCGESHPALRYKFRRKEDNKPQRTLSREQVNRLLASIDTDTPIGKRNAAIVLLMLDTGLRASEVCRLELKYLDIERGHLAVRGKGGRWREGVFSARTARALQEWLNVRPATKGVKTVFVSVGGLTPGKPLTSSGLKVILRKLGQRSGIGLISPHDFRRTFATMAIRAGAPSRLVQLAGGWRNLEMVERYSRALKVEDFQGYFPSEQITIDTE